VAANPTTMATIIPTTAGTKYMSAIDCTGSDVGVGETSAGASAPIAVWAYEAKYAPEPAKVAMTVYLPGMSGVHCKLYWPLVSVVAVPISLKLPFASITLSTTSTPIASVGLVNCL